MKEKNEILRISKCCNLSKHYNYLGLKYLHANVQYIYIGNAKYHMPAATDLVQVKYPVYAPRLQKAYEEEKQGQVKNAVILSK